MAMQNAGIIGFRSELDSARTNPFQLPLLKQGKGLSLPLLQQGDGRGFTAESKKETVKLCLEKTT